MTGLLLVALLNLSPGIRLADNFEQRRAELTQHRPTPPWYSEADELPQHVVEELNAKQLRGVLLILEERRPNYLLPSILFAVGLGVGIPVGLIAYSVFLSASSSANIIAAIFTVFFAGYLAVVAAACGLLALAGVAVFVVRGFQRNTYMAVEDRVRARLLAIEVKPLPPPASPPETLPPPPQANFVVPRAMQTVISF